jgi:hypothetical protein
MDGEIRKELKQKEQLLKLNTRIKVSIILPSLLEIFFLAVVLGHGGLDWTVDKGWWGRNASFPSTKLCV